MVLRQLCKDMKKRPLKALFFFPGENLTGIAPTWLIIEKDRELTEGMKVTVNWHPAVTKCHGTEKNFAIVESSL